MELSVPWVQEFKGSAILYGACPHRYPDCMANRVYRRSGLMKIKVSEATGKALDWLVSEALGRPNIGSPSHVPYDGGGFHFTYQAMEQI
jgi:hypothetical protein